MVWHKLRCWSYMNKTCWFLILSIILNDSEVSHSAKMEGILNVWLSRVSSSHTVLVPLLLQSRLFYYQLTWLILTKLTRKSLTISILHMHFNLLVDMLKERRVVLGSCNHLQDEQQNGLNFFWEIFSQYLHSSLSVYFLLRNLVIS